MEMNTLVRIHITEQTRLSTDQKELLLLKQMAELPSLVVALSGGADSAYLAWAAHRAIGSHALSVTALSPSYSAHDRIVVEAFVRQLGVRHEFIETHEMENPKYRGSAASPAWPMASTPMTPWISAPATAPRRNIASWRPFSTPDCIRTKFACSPNALGYPLGTAPPPRALPHAFPTGRK